MSESAVVSRRLEGTIAEFRADAALAVGVWRSAPYLVIVALVLRSYPPLSFFEGPTPQNTPVTAEVADAGLALLLVVVAVIMFLLTAGWSGAERLVYAWTWAGIDTDFRRAVSAAWGFVGRFLVLGLLLLIPLIVAGLILSVALEPRMTTALTSFLIGVVLTFVIPVLSYDEERPTVALRLGVRMLRIQGRRAVWYAVIGPAALGLIVQIEAAVPAFRWVSWIVIALLALALRGATAAAYLRLTRAEGIAAPPPAGP